MQIRQNTNILRHKSAKNKKMTKQTHFCRRQELLSGTDNIRIGVLGCGKQSFYGFLLNGFGSILVLKVGKAEYG